MDFSIIDIETTGFSRKNDRIVEVAIVKINENGEIIKGYETLVNPIRDVGPTHIHGITATDVINAPSFSEVKDTILGIINNSILVAHNKSFDFKFLECEFLRAGIEIQPIDGICTLSMSKKIFPELPSRKLSVLCEYLDINIENAHRAYDDCLATAKLFYEMYKIFVEEYSPIELIDWFADDGLFKYPVGSYDHVEFKRLDAKKEIYKEESKMQRFINRIPDNYRHNDSNISEYLNLLDRVLEDRLITDEELEEIEHYTTLYKLSSKSITSIHKEYFRRLVRYYLSDNYLSNSELIDLDKVSSLLYINDSDTIINLEKTEFNFEKTNAPESKKSFSEKSVCFTGQFVSKLKGELITRDLAHSIAIEKGLVVKKAVTKKLDLLVVSDPNSLSTKARKAKKYGTRIIVESVFWRELGIKIE